MLESGYVRSSSNQSVYIDFVCTFAHLRFLSPSLQEAECKREMMDIKFQADTKMADSKRELEMQKAAFNQEVNTKVLMGLMSSRVSEMRRCAI